MIQYEMKCVSYPEVLGILLRDDSMLHMNVQCNLTRSEKGARYGNFNSYTDLSCDINNKVYYLSLIASSRVLRC